MHTDYHGKKVAVLGYGINNKELIPFLLARGADVTVCDKNETIEQTPGVHYQLGDSYLSGLNNFDIIFRTPGIPFLTPEIQEAKNQGVIISSQTQLFLEECPAKTIGVTGTKGKGTTASLIAHLLERAQKEGELPGRTFLAGNIGRSAIGLLAELTENDWVVLELSSFQLQDMTLSPHIAVILSVTSDHLDHHHSLEEYREAKKNLVRYQSPQDYVVVLHDSPVSMTFLDQTHAMPFFFSTQQMVNPGAFVHGDYLYYQPSNNEAFGIAALSDVRLVGRYNLQNVTAALTVGALLGASPQTLREGVSTFSGLPHRLEFVAEKGGVSYYDDSKSTNPGSTEAAIQAFSQPQTLILGGSSKEADFTSLVNTIKQSSATTIITIGEEGKRIKQLLQEASAPQELVDGAATMPEIVKQAQAATRPGGVVVLSPACASFDMFQNAEDRGNQFKQAVKDLS